ncbi:pantetheine-phosphate adenylyltransferase [Gleimia coleocanis]|nr:pantetheine-phosphate adenylyltransferase [Gleimia coleocanis]
MVTAVIPGSFDPVTVGHLDVVKRCAQLFPEVVVLVASNSAKQYWFDSSQRVSLIEASVVEFENVRVEATNGLLMDWCQANLDGEVVLIKGIRSATDFDYETVQAVANRALGKIETLFLPAEPTHAHISSSLVKELAKHHGNIENLVSKPVFKAINRRLETN